MSRVAAIIKNGLVENVISIADGDKGSAEIELRGIPEVTETGVGIGWTYKDGKFIEPPKTQQQLDAESNQLAKAEARSTAEAKLVALGLTVEDLKALLG